MIVLLFLIVTAVTGRNATAHVEENEPFASAAESAQRRTSAVEKENHGAYSCLISNNLGFKVLLFLCPFLGKDLAAAGEGREQAAHGEEDGETGEGDVKAGAAFPETEVQEQRSFCFSC